MQNYGCGSNLPTIRLAINVQFQPLDSDIWGGVPNVHMPMGNATIPPLFLGIHGKSLIEMTIPSANQSGMVCSVLVTNPQGIPNQSMGVSDSQTQMRQGGTAYTGGNFIP